MNTFLAVVAVVATVGWFFVLGWMLGTQRMHRAIFHPWMRSLQPGDPDYWVRARDYDAAWQCSIRADRIPYHKALYTDETFDTPPRYARERAA